MIKHDPYINRIIFSEYLIQKKIGKGSFGTVYQGKVVSTDQKIAIKLEKKEKDDSGLLETEACRLYLMQGEGIPKIICYGNNQTHNILIQELLGHSLEELFNLNGRKFTLKTVCSIGIEMIKRIKFVHSKYHIHRDIKPDNFMTGREKEDNKIYIIDFGLAKKYYSVSKKSHIKFRTGKNLIGTARYCGRNAHKGYEQGRRDDIESIGYVLIYFLNGILPWQGLKAMKGEDQFEKIAEKKYNTSFEELTRNNPEEFLLYFKHCDSLKFEDEPNYDYLLSLFKTMINKYCIDCLYDYDWKKNTIPNLSSIKDKEINNNNKDISLLVHNNISAIESKGEGKEEDKINNNIKMKKDVFIGEDKHINENELKEKILKRNKSSNLLNRHSLIKENLEMNNDTNINDFKKKDNNNDDSKNDNINLNNNDINLNNNNIFSISNISPQNKNIKDNNFDELLNKRKSNNYHNYNLNKKIIKKEYFFTYDQNMDDMVNSNKSTIKEDYKEENNYKNIKQINRFQQPKKLENIFTEEDIKSEEINDINDENEKPNYKNNNNINIIKNSFINSKVQANNISNKITNFQFNINDNKKVNDENYENNHTHKKEHHNHHNNNKSNHHISHNHHHHNNKSEDNHNNDDNNKSNTNNLSTDTNNINSDKNLKEMKDKNENNEENKKKIEGNEHKNSFINQNDENEIKKKRRNRVKSVDNKIKKNNPGCYCFIF